MGDSAALFLDLILFAKDCPGSDPNGTFSVSWRAPRSRIALGRRTCAGFVGYGVEEYISVVATPRDLLTSRAESSFACDLLHSSNGVRFGVGRVGE